MKKFILLWAIIALSVGGCSYWWTKGTDRSPMTDSQGKTWSDYIKEQMQENEKGDKSSWLFIVENQS